MSWAVFVLIPVMPAGPVDFRGSCGPFVFVYISFMAKRARRAMDMRMRLLRPRSRLEGVLVGLVLVTFLTSDLLLRAGNVETNPGPSDGKEGSRTVQTRLTAAGGRTGSSSGDRRTSASGKAATEPTLGDLMCKLTSMDSSMHNNFDQVREELREMRTEVGQLQREVQECQDRVNDMEREN